MLPSASDPDPASPLVSRHALHMFVILACLFCASVPSLASEKANGSTSTAANTQRIQDVVDDLRARLLLSQNVVVSIVPSNPLVVSVEPPRDGDDRFQLSFEDRFLDLLSQDEIEAAIAHELGHVWIFSHHPYLQTEQLANRIAMRAVSRDSLQRVYAKLWERGGMKGDLTQFLGN